MQWSVYFQNPEFLEYTRLFLIQPELKPLVRAWCGIRDGMKILDVGCGTGYFTRLLAEGGENVAITGLDLEEPFIAYAKDISVARIFKEHGHKKSDGSKSANRYRWLTSSSVNACRLLLVRPLKVLFLSSA